jgi:endonuclease/exonuclease/phosphatase family metal-dependent hydrolase
LNGYRAVWQPAAYWPPGRGGNQGQQWEGLAILSRHAIVDRATVRLEQDLDDPHNHFPRLVLGAQIRSPAGPLWLFDTHFPLSVRARERVAPIALDFVTRTAGGLPFVFTGDFNASPDELCIRFFTGREPIGDQKGTLNDAWANCHPGQDGYTFSAWEPRKRIDYAFVSSRVQVREIAIVGNTPNHETHSPSDHCGLLAELDI